MQAKCFHRQNVSPNKSSLNAYFNYIYKFVGNAIGETILPVGHKKRGMHLPKWSIPQYGLAVEISSLLYSLAY